MYILTYLAFPKGWEKYLGHQQITHHQRRVHHLLHKENRKRHHAACQQNQYGHIKVSRIEAGLEIPSPSHTQIRYPHALDCNLKTRHVIFQIHLTNMWLNIPRCEAVRVYRGTTCTSYTPWPLTRPSKHPTCTLLGAVARKRKRKLVKFE